MAFTWDLAKEQATFAINGKAGKINVIYRDNHSLSTYVHDTKIKTYQVGIPKTINNIGENPFSGYMKHLMVFDKPLNIDEINHVMGRFTNSLLPKH